MLALPGSDNSIRGLTVDGWIVADEAARLTENLIAALRPMRARRPADPVRHAVDGLEPHDPFWIAWASDDPSWIRLKATADDVDIFSEDYLDQERRELGEAAFKREYLGCRRATRQARSVGSSMSARPTRGMPFEPPGAAFRPPPPAPTIEGPNPFRELKRKEWCHDRATWCNRTDPHPHRPASWPDLPPLMIAHDVAWRATARRPWSVAAGPLRPVEGRHSRLPELPQGAVWQCAGECACRDRSALSSDALIVADLSNEASYGEYLYETFGSRVIGMRISRHGDGKNVERRPVGRGSMLVYTVGRTFLIDHYHNLLATGMVRLATGPDSRRIYAQLGESSRWSCATAARQGLHLLTGPAR